MSKVLHRDLKTQNIFLTGDDETGQGSRVKVRRFSESGVDMVKVGQSRAGFNHVLARVQSSSRFSRRKLFSCEIPVSARRKLPG